MPRTSQAIIDHAEALADAFENSEPNPLPENQQAVMFELRDAVIAQGVAELAVARAVKKARERGVSWALIAGTLGTSRQAAQKRYG